MIAATVICRTGWTIAFQKQDGVQPSTLSADSAVGGSVRALMPEGSTSGLLPGGHAALMFAPPPQVLSARAASLSQNSIALPPTLLAARAQL